MTTQTIVYFKNGLGNFIEMTPSMIAVASMDPSGKVDVLLDPQWIDSRREAFEDILRNWDIIEDVVMFPKDQIKKDYTRWFYSKHTEESEGLKLFEEKTPLFGQRINWKRGLVNEIDYYMNLAREQGYKKPTPPQCCPLANTPTLVGKLRIGLCNGAFGIQRDAKQWYYFKRLSEVLKLWYTNCTIIKIGNGKELSEVDTGIDYVGKLSMTQTAKVISQLDLLITTDTGNMHIADALNIPQVVLWGPTLVSKNGPRNHTSTLVRTQLPCQPCQYTNKFTGCQTRECMRGITIGDVMHHVRKRLA